MADNAVMAVGIDIGGTNTRMAVVDREGVLHEKIRMSTAMNGPEFLSQIADAAGKLARNAGQSGHRIAGIGIGMPGLISPSGRIFSSVNLPHCEGVNLSDELHAVTGIPAVTVNDANAAAFGEYLFGAGRPFRTFMMITIGTGIGGGIVLDGRLWSGAHGFAGEFGHLTVVPGGKRCRCGNSGCVEQYSSATAIMNAARAEGMLPLADVSVEDLASLAYGGDMVARSLFENAGHYLGAAAASVVNLLNPEAIIVGGGVAASFSLMHDAMRCEIDRRSYRAAAEHLRLLQCELCDDAGVLGAAAVAFDRFDNGR